MCIFWRPPYSHTAVRWSIAHVSTIKTIAVPPYSEALVVARIDSNYKLQTSLVEPIKELHHKRLALSRCVILPTCHQTNIRILFPTSATVYLKRKTQIGTIVPNDEQSIDNAEEENVEKRNPVPTPTLASPEEILSDLGIEVDKAQMSEEDYTKLSIFSAKNRDMFAKSLYDLPGTDVVQHKIDTGDQEPPRERLYRTTPAQKREVEAQLKENNVKT